MIKLKAFRCGKYCKCFTVVFKELCINITFLKEQNQDSAWTHMEWPTSKSVWLLLLLETSSDMSGFTLTSATLMSFSQQSLFLLFSMQLKEVFFYFCQCKTRVAQVDIQIMQNADLHHVPLYSTCKFTLHIFVRPLFCFSQHSYYELKY